MSLDTTVIFIELLNAFQGAKINLARKIEN